MTYYNQTDNILYENGESLPKNLDGTIQGNWVELITQEEINQAKTEIEARKQAELANQPNWQGFLDLIRGETLEILDELAQDSPSLQSYLFSAFDQTNPEKILKFWNKAVEKSPRFRNALEVEYEPGLTRADWFRQEAPKYNIPATLNADLTLSPI